MRTRRSHRNQNRLWKALSGPATQAPPPSPILSDAEIDAAYPTMNKTSRNLLKRDMAKRRRMESTR